MNQYIITGLILLALIGWGSYEHTRFLNERLAYSDFREQTTAQVLKQEKAHNDQINSAMAERDASLLKLRHQVRSNASFLPKTTGSSETACYDRSRLDAALSKFEEGIRGLLTEGDEAVIDNKAWASAWPK